MMLIPRLKNGSWAFILTVTTFFLSFGFLADRYKLAIEQAAAKADKTLEIPLGNIKSVRVIEGDNDNWRPALQVQVFSGASNAHISYSERNHSITSTIEKSITQEDILLIKLTPKKEATLGDYAEFASRLPRDGAVMIALPPQIRAIAFDGPKNIELTGPLTLISGDLTLREEGCATNTSLKSLNIEELSFSRVCIHQEGPDNSQHPDHNTLTLNNEVSISRLYVSMLTGKIEIDPNTKITKARLDLSPKVNVSAPSAFLRHAEFADSPVR